jgi:hypothetical protein
MEEGFKSSQVTCLFALYFRKHTMIRNTLLGFLLHPRQDTRENSETGKHVQKTKLISAAGGIRSDVLFRGGRAAAQAEVGDKVLALVDGLAVVAGGLLAVLAGRVAPAGRHVGADAVRWQLLFANAADVAARPLCSDERKD